MPQTNLIQAAAAILDPAAAQTGIAGRRSRLERESADSPPASPPIWTPVRTAGASLTTDELLSRTRPPEQLPSELEAAILHTLRRPLEAEEGHRDGNANRERELCSLFMGLTAVQCLQLRGRLDRDADSDQIAVAFRRLVMERRQRLRAALVRQCATAATRCR